MKDETEKYIYCERIERNVRIIPEIQVPDCGGHFSFVGGECRHPDYALGPCPL
jgi:hypothetical protein